jgi:arabinan endo-1,5-alpha-L-arabinosidase
MHSIFTFLTRLAFALLAAGGVATAIAKQVSIHDPVMAKEGDTYYLFSTGPGITIYSSQDLQTWRHRGRVFATQPTWATDVVPRFNGHVWAPDISRHGDTYYLYYSVSRGGKNTSAIGVATNKTLDPDAPGYAWVDHGIVIRSIPNRDLWNAIDPNLTFDEHGTPWLAFGSFWAGLKLVKLAPSLTAIAEPQEWHVIAKRERSVLVDDIEPEPAQIEAPFIVRHGDYYHLFVSWDKCCAGKRSNYKLVVGRARDIRGPYLDKAGKSLAEGGGTLLLAGDADWPGLGHNSVYTFDGKDYMVFHAYEAADNGLQKLKIAALAWDADGWPVVDGAALHAYSSELTGPEPQGMRPPEEANP